MKKKLMALLAAVAAVFGFGFAANTALAVDYGATIPVTGNTVTYSVPAGTFQPYETVTATFDDGYVTDVVLAAQRSKQFQAKADGGLDLRVTLTDAGVKAAQEGKMPHIILTGETSGTVFTITLVAPATGEGDQSGDNQGAGDKGTTADTGAAIAPYAIVVALLTAAGIAIFSVRKANAR
ncbi:hypothetical protein [Bifidobacterium samirii]|uniref:Uncharacterized protein n=1 Tax=Bifidobacterium samirii TaxID=2306974 RepID=A0A430FVM8_9BIFI|nr:hypothetical protein [Bifidobacterium samirii]RSX58066.1 hypothetical protein D2E24_0426 [Bifidobacterium samirii]